jgi:Flp pilus assembly pilin Flp
MLKFQLAVLRLLGTERRHHERGATLVEYALLLALIVVVCISAVTLVGPAASAPLSSIRGPLR